MVYLTGDVFASTSELPQVSVNHVGRLCLAPPYMPDVCFAPLTDEHLDGPFRLWD